MPYELFLAFRYLRRARREGRRATAQVTALAAAIGIACGVAALIVALALANGFRDELRDKILRGTAHLTLMRADNQSITEWKPIVARLRVVAGVVDATATTYTGALLSGPGGASYTVLRGVDPQSARVASELRRVLIAGAIEPLLQDAAPHSKVEEATAGESSRGKGNEESHRKTLGRGGGTTSPVGESPEDSVSGELSAADLSALMTNEATDEEPTEAIVGSELAARTGLERVGAEGWIMTGARVPDPPGFRPRARRIRVAGVFHSGLYDYDAAWAYVPLDVAAQQERAASESAPGVSAISIEVADIYATESVAEGVRRVVGDRRQWTIVDWREANRPLFAALELERRIVALIISLIMIVAALSITTTLVLIVIERRGDIAILIAMGARPRSIMCIFVIEGAVVGAIGALAGITLGLAACFVGDYFQLVRLPADVYSLSAVPFHATVRDTLLPALVAFTMSLLATIYPARAAARVRPAEALRYDG